MTAKRLNKDEAQALAKAVELLASTTKKERQDVLAQLEKNIMKDSRDVTTKEWQEAWCDIGKMKLLFQKFDELFPQPRKAAEKENQG